MSSIRRAAAAVTLAKVETTYGTDAAPSYSTAADVVRQAARPEVTLNYAYDGARGDAFQGNAKPIRQTPKGRWINGTIKTHGRGYGAAYTSSAVTVPDTHALLRAAGFSATVSTTGGAEKWTFQAESDTASPASATIWHYVRGGELWKATGCYCDLTITADGIGIPEWAFTYNGIAAQAITEPGIQTPTFNVASVLPPPATNIAFTLGNLTGAVVRSFTFTLGRSIDTARQNQNATSGHSGFVPGPREPKLEVLVEATGLQGSPYTATAALDPYQLIDNATSGLAWSLTVGGTQYNKWKLYGSQAQVTAAPLEVDGHAALWRLVITPYTTESAQTTDDVIFEFS